MDLLYDEMSAYPTGESLIEVRWRTLIGNRAIGGRGKAPKEVRVYYKAWRKYLEERYDTSSPNSTRTKISPLAKQYSSAVDLLGYHKVGTTQKGYVGLVPYLNQAGDQVCIIRGGATLYVVRKSMDRPGMVRFLGSCYFHGLMDGQGSESHFEGEQDIFMH